jgi:hypothetical protein
MLVARFCALASCVAFVSAFPTVNNIANLVRAGGLDVPSDLSYDDVLSQLKRQQEKRLLVNSLDQPIAGESRTGPSECC